MTDTPKQPLPSEEVVTILREQLSNAMNNPRNPTGQRAAEAIAIRALDLLDAANARTLAERALREMAEADLQRFIADTHRLFVAQNILINKVWTLLGGQDDTRPGGSNLVGRVREFVARAEAAESRLAKVIEALSAADYYIDRLETVQRRIVVRDLWEARAGYEHARALSGNRSGW